MDTTPTYEELAQRVQELETAREALHKYAALVSAITDPAAYVDRDYTYRIVNDAYVRYYQKPKSEIVGRPIPEFLGREPFETVVRPLLDRCFAGETVLNRHWFDFPGQDRRYIETTYYPVYDESGQAVAGASVHSRDRTDWKKSEDALLESENRYRSMFRNRHVVMLMIDPETGAILDANPAAVAFYGWTYEELTGMTIADINALPTEAVFSEMRAALNRYRGFFHFRHRLRNGEIRDVEVSSGPVEHGGKIILYSIIHDVTRRKRTEDALKKSKEKYRMLVNTMHEGIWRIDDRDVTTYVNPQMARMLGYTVEEMRGKHLFAFMDDHGKEQCIRNLERRRQGISEQHDFEFLKKDGGTLYALMETVALFGEDGVYQGALASVMDITHRRQAEQALQESEERHKKISRLSSDYFYALNVDDARRITIDWVSDSFERVTTYKHEEIKAFDEWMSKIHPDDIVAMHQNTAALLTNTPVTSEYRFKTRSGEIRWYIDRLHPEWCRKKHRVVKVYGAVRDITDRKRAEAALRASLAQKEVLLREIHHRVKNNMQAIIGLLRMHARRIEDDRLTALFDDCRDRVAAMALVHEALYQSKDLARIDFESYLKKLCRNLGQAYDARGRGVSVNVDRCGVALNMDQGIAVGMVISELISNAFKHAFPHRDGGNVTVNLSAPETGMAELIVADNGVGLPPDFDIHRSTSLGLRLVRGAVTRELGGAIDVVQDGGAQFVIRFECDQDTR